MILDKKIIAFDLDGTLTVSKSPITKEMADLIKALAKKKIVVIISGGKFEQFKTQFLPLFLNDNSFIEFIDNLILLPTSGSQRYEYDVVKKDWNLTDKEIIDEKIKNKIKKLLQDIIDNSNLYEIPNNPIGDIIEDRDTQISFSALGQLAPYEEKKHWDPNYEKRKKIIAKIAPYIPEVTIAMGGSTTIDIISKDFNKAKGLMRLLDKLNLNKSDMLFIGDAVFPGGNDYSPKESGIETISVKGPEETSIILDKMLGL